ncbi:hypothetical protein N7527_006008 [Penicillium freii]|nr:hypothetical protein N7527_006008 [Penicillium freii]
MHQGFQRLRPVCTAPPAVAAASSHWVKVCVVPPPGKGAGDLTVSSGDYCCDGMYPLLPGSSIFV